MVWAPSLQAGIHHAMAHMHMQHNMYLCWYIIKTHVRGFLDTDLHEVSWHFATHEAVRPSGF